MKKSDLNGKVICASRKHWVALVLPAVLAIMLLICGISTAPEAESSSETIASSVIMAALVFGIAFLKWKTEVIILTTKEIYGRTGIIKKHTLSAPISKIDTVDIEAGPIGRALGYGNIKIRCISAPYNFKRFANAEKMRKAITNRILRVQNVSMYPMQEYPREQPRTEYREDEWQRMERQEYPREEYSRHERPFAEYPEGGRQRGNRQRAERPRGERQMRDRPPYSERGYSEPRRRPPRRRNGYDD